MDLIKIKLIDYDDLNYAFYGLRVCTDTLNRINPENYEKNINLLKHALDDEVPHLSILKHINYKFLIQGVPRSFLQEYTRHTVGNYINVLSTRWALHKVFKNEELNPNKKEEIVKKCYCFCGGIEDLSRDDEIYQQWINDRFRELVTMKKLKGRGIGNDKLKFLVHENLRTTIFSTISALAMRNLLNQRLYKDAWYVFRYVAELMYKQIPEDHKLLFRDIVSVRLGDNNVKKNI